MVQVIKARIPLDPGISCRQSKKGEHRNAHDAAVVGLAPDAANRILTSAGHDGVLRVWDFKKQTLLREIPVESPPGRLASRSGTALVAVASADLVLRM